VAVFRGRSKTDVYQQIADARRLRKIGDLTDIAAIIDPLPSIDPKLLRPERRSSAVKGYPDQPDHPENFHPAERRVPIPPAPLLTPKTVGRVTYFRFTPMWNQIAPWRYLTNGGRRAVVDVPAKTRLRWPSSPARCCSSQGHSGCCTPPSRRLKTCCG